MTNPSPLDAAITYVRTQQDLVVRGQMDAPAHEPLWRVEAPWVLRKTALQLVAWREADLGARVDGPSGPTYRTTTAHVVDWLRQQAGTARTDYAHSQFVTSTVYDLLADALERGGTAPLISSPLNRDQPDGNTLQARDGCRVGRLTASDPLGYHPINAYDDWCVLAEQLIEAARTRAMDDRHVQQWARHLAFARRRLDRQRVGWWERRPARVRRAIRSLRKTVMRIEQRAAGIRP